MKTIANKVSVRTYNTRMLVAQLPPVFTRAQYEELRHQQMYDLYHANKAECPYLAPDYYACHVCGYKLDNLVQEGLIVVVATETFPKEVEKWNYMARTYETKTIEVQRNFYSLTDELENFFTKVLDNNPNL